MAKWKEPSEAEAREARKLGLDKRDIVVNRVDEDRIVILVMKSRREIIVSVPEKQEEGSGAYGKGDRRGEESA